MVKNLAESNEQVAIDHMRAVCKAWRDRDSATMRARIKVLTELAETTTDKHIQYAAKESQKILQLHERRHP